MRVKFTKASRDDKTLVTVTLSQFDKEGILDRSRLVVGDEIELTIDRQPVVFRVNRVRNGKGVTAVTYCYPRYLRLPSVGYPQWAAVTEIG